MLDGMDEGNDGEEENGVGCLLSRPREMPKEFDGEGGDILQFENPVAMAEDEPELVGCCIPGGYIVCEGHGRCDGSGAIGRGGHWRWRYAPERGCGSACPSACNKLRRSREKVLPET